MCGDVDFCSRGVYTNMPFHYGSLSMPRLLFSPILIFLRASLVAGCSVEWGGTSCASWKVIWRDSEPILLCLVQRSSCFLAKTQCNKRSAASLVCSASQACIYDCVSQCMMSASSSRNTACLSLHGTNAHQAPPDAPTTSPCKIRQL
jgi:hypothetical protein